MRFLPLALAVAALAAAAPTASAHDPTTPEGAPVPRLDWRACDDGFQCATAEVPRDYSRPRGPKVRLAVIRHPALDPEHKIGSLFVNNGGPGLSPVDFVRTAPPPAFALLSRFDVVGFDPRGVGGSVPNVDCDEPAAREPFMTPDTLDVGALLRRGRELAHDCLNRDPAFLASVNNGNMARDMDALRAAVGDKQLTYLGISAGGMLGQVYSGLFPGRARALVLDSPIDANVWLNDPLRANREHRNGFEAGLERFFRACATCGADPDDAFDDLVARLDAAPLDLGDGDRLTGQDVERTTLELLYSKRDWPRIEAGLAAARSGDVAAARDFVALIRDPQYDLEFDVFDTYDFVERRYPRRLEPYLDSAEHLFTLAPHFAFGAYESVSHLFWPVEPRGAYYGPFRNPPSATPALVIHGTHDPVTPFAWGKRVVRNLGNARLLTYRGDGHGVLTNLEPCPLGYLAAYLEDGVLPPAGASCTQESAATATALRRPHGSH